MLVVNYFVRGLAKICNILLLSLVLVALTQSEHNGTAAELAIQMKFELFYLAEQMENTPCSLDRVLTSSKGSEIIMWLVMFETSVLFARIMK